MAAIDVNYLNYRNPLPPVPVFFLVGDDFPDPRLANEDGILAVGGDLSPQRLLLAYRKGLFPWYNEGEPILWWCPDPRLTVVPSQVKMSKSMRAYFNRQKFTVTYDTAFEEVIRGCQTNDRKGQTGTWISEEIIHAYRTLHDLGYAHSVEVWEGANLVGGLYGLAIGKVFFGESMFARVSNASKFGFITLARRLEREGCWLVDCQQETPHLASLGAVAIDRNQFLDLLEQNEAHADLGYLFI